MPVYFQGEIESNPLAEGPSAGPPAMLKQLPLKNTSSAFHVTCVVISL
jgi:hypothetical protein